MTERGEGRGKEMAEKKKEEGKDRMMKKKETEPKTKE